MSKLEALGGKNQHSSLPWFEYLQPPKTLQEFNILQLSANLSTEELLHASSPWTRVCEVRFKFLTYTSKLIQGKYCGCSITATQKNRICYDFWGLFGNTVYFWTKVILLYWKEVEKTKRKKIPCISQQTFLHMGSYSRTANSNSNIPVLVRPKIAMLRLAEKKVKNIFLYYEVGPSAMAPNDTLTHHNSVHW